LETNLPFKITSEALSSEGRERHFALIEMTEPSLRASSCTRDRNESDAYFSSI